MKKIIAMLLALSMVLAMAACGGSSAPATEAPKTEAPASGPPRGDRVCLQPQRRPHGRVLPLADTSHRRL